MTCSKKMMQESNSVSEDAVATYWITVEQNENFENYTLYTMQYSQNFHAVPLSSNML